MIKPHRIADGDYLLADANTVECTDRAEHVQLRGFNQHEGQINVHIFRLTSQSPGYTPTGNKDHVSTVVQLGKPGTRNLSCLLRQDMFVCQEQMALLLAGYHKGGANSLRGLDAYNSSL